MKVAPIVPPNYLDLVTEHNYHMALAHVVLMNESYRTWFAERKDGVVLILDNSAYELDVPLQGPELAAACSHVRPDILVIPDDQWNEEKNYWLAKSFELLSRTLNVEHPDLLFMAVPHADNRNSYLDSIDELCQLDYVGVIGLSKTSRRLNLRPELAKRAIEHGRKVHFLGVHADPIIEVLEGKEVDAQYPGSLLGLDSSYPFRLGLAGRTLLEFLPTPKSISFIEDRPIGTDAEVSLSWIKRQLTAFQYLAESNISTVEELEVEYKNGRF